MLATERPLFLVPVTEADGTGITAASKGERPNAAGLVSGDQHPKPGGSATNAMGGVKRRESNEQDATERFEGDLRG